MEFSINTRFCSHNIKECLSVSRMIKNYECELCYNKVAPLCEECKLWFTRRFRYKCDLCYSDEVIAPLCEMCDYWFCSICMPVIRVGRGTDPAAQEEYGPCRQIDGNACPRRAPVYGTT